MRTIELQRLGARSSEALASTGLEGFVRLVSRRSVVFEVRVPSVYVASLSRRSSTVPLTFYSGTGVG